MNRQQKKAAEVLSGYLRAKREIERIDSVLEEYNKTGMPAQKIKEKTKALSRSRLKAFEEINRVSNMIEKMKPGKEKNILTYRFISGMKFDAIAEKLCYSESQIMRDYNAALAHIFENGIKRDSARDRKQEGKNRAKTGQIRQQEQEGPERMKKGI